eukprot:2527115-Amphidinium_carterae.1
MYGFAHMNPVQSCAPMLYNVAAISSGYLTTSSLRSTPLSSVYAFLREIRRVAGRQWSSRDRAWACAVQRGAAGAVDARANASIDAIGADGVHVSYH